MCLSSSVFREFHSGHEARECSNSFPAMDVRILECLEHLSITYSLSPVSAVKILELLRITVFGEVRVA